MSRFSPSVLPAPNQGFFGSLTRALPQGVQIGVHEYDLAQQRAEQAKRDAAAAQQQAFANRLALEAQNRTNAVTGYTPGGQVTVAPSDLAQALGRSAAAPFIAGVGSASGMEPPMTVQAPGTYDFTKSASYQNAQHAAVIGAAQRAQQLADQLRLHQQTRDYDVAHPTVSEQAQRTRANRPPASRTAAPPTRAAFVLKRIAELRKPGHDVMGRPVQGMNLGDAQAQANQEYDAAYGNGSTTVPAPGLAAVRAQSGAPIDTGPSTVVNGVPVTQGPPEVAPAPTATAPAALSSGAQKVVGRIQASGGQLSVRDALASPSVPDAIKVELIRYYRLNDAGGGR